MHYLSYAIKYKTEVKTFYKITKPKYFHYTNESIFETKLLDNLLADIMFKHTSFKGFTAAYNFINAPKIRDRFYLIPSRLTENFYVFHINKYFNEHFKGQLQCNYLEKYKLLDKFNFKRYFYLINSEYQSFKKHSL